MGQSEDGDTNSDFKSQFYNLQGIHINERKKNFYKLLKSTSVDIHPDQIDLQPRNFQENLFYVDALIHFRQVDKLIDILKEGKGVLASKILKHKWFFKEAFENQSENDIVNIFLPTLTYPLRMKVLKKLALVLSTEKMDKMFDLILERYGIFTAKQFLFSCSSEKIVTVLRNNNITLLPEQLKRIMQKDVDLLKVYFEEYKKNMKKDFDDYDFLNYLLWKRPDMCFEFNLNKDCLRLGRCTTKAVLKINRENIVKDIENTCWSKAAIIRELKEFGEEYLFLFFPDDMADLNCYSGSYRLKSFLSKYPITKRWEVFSKAFRKAYNCEIVENLDCFEENLAEFFSVEIRQKWAEIKFLNTDDLQYLNYYSPKRAFEILKDKINFTCDVYQRRILLEHMISVCHENSDYSTYEDVLKYIYSRHRNEDARFRSSLCFHIQSNIDYNLLTQVHWTYINKLKNIQTAKEHCYFCYVFSPKYFKFLYKNALSPYSAVEQYIKDIVKENRTFELTFGFKSDEDKKNPDVESAVLRLIIKILPKLNLKNEKYWFWRITDDIVNFNKKISQDKPKEFKQFLIDLNECPPSIDIIREVCTKKEPYVDNDCNIVRSLLAYNSICSENPLKVVNDNHLLNIIQVMSKDRDQKYSFLAFILELMQKNKRSDFENKLLDFCFNNLEHPIYGSQQAIEYFLANDPEVIVKYYNVILQLDVESRALNYNTIKRYSHLDLDKKLISYFSGLISINSNIEPKRDVLKALATTMNTKDFLDLVKDYTPDSTKLDLDNEKQKKLYQAQCDLVYTFKNLDELALSAPVLMHFSQGDYLQASLPALYKVLYHLNEDSISFYLNILGSSNMSTRKHAVFLALQLLSFKDAMAMYSVLSNKETNISAKKYLFDTILKYFIKNPSESLLEIVFINMNFVNKNDSEMIQRLVDSVDKVPYKYIPLFIEKVWNYLDLLECEQVNVDEHRKGLLRKTDKYDTSFFLKLNKNFFESIITKHFFKSMYFQDALESFVTNYLLAYCDENNFKSIFAIIKTYKNLHWEASEKDKIIYLFNFFDQAYVAFYNNMFFKLFEKHWLQVFNKEECFTEYIMFKLMAIYKKNIKLEMFTKEVDVYFQEIVEEYGPYTAEFLLKSVREFFEKAYAEDTTFKAENFVFYLLKSTSNDLNCFIAYSVIKNVDVKKHREVFSRVLDVLKAVDNINGKIYYNILLKREYL